jgi:hypothetical protein
MNSRQGSRSPSLGCRRDVMQSTCRRAHDGERKSDRTRARCVLVFLSPSSRSPHTHESDYLIRDSPAPEIFIAPILRSVSRLVLFHRTWDHGFLCRCCIRHLAPHPRSVSRWSTRMALNLVLRDVSSASESRPWQRTVHHSHRSARRLPTGHVRGCDEPSPVNGLAPASLAPVALALVMTQLSCSCVEMTHARTRQL